jgi:hypothetical protein
LEQSRIDFNGSITRASRGGYLCLALVLTLFSTGVIYYKSMLRAMTMAREQSMAVADRSSSGHAAAGDTKQAELHARRWQAAQNVVAHLNVPWSSLFAALEEAAGGDIAVLRVEPDAARHEVHVTVETDNIARAIAYATRLQSNGSFTNVYLTSQRPSPGSPARPLQVVIAGRWISIEPPHRTEPDVAPLHASASE